MGLPGSGLDVVEADVIVSSVVVEADFEAVTDDIINCGKWCACFYWSNLKESFSKNCLKLGADNPGLAGNLNLI